MIPLIIASYLAIGGIIGLRMAHVDPIGGECGWEQEALGIVVGAIAWPLMLPTAFGVEETSTGEPFWPRRHREPDAEPADGGELWPGERKLDERFDSILSEPIGPPPDHQIELWSPAEREIFGHNETLRLIDRIDRALKDIERTKIVDSANKAKVEMPDLSTLRARPEPEFETETVRSWDGSYVHHVTIRGEEP